MIYMRGQHGDYDHWTELGNRGWFWDDVLPVFKRPEDYCHGAVEYHGKIKSPMCCGQDMTCST